MVPKPTHFDAIVIGAGFGGIYALKTLLDQGLSVKVLDAAGDVGGTWYWNRYPGAMSDTESYIYRYSWDKEDLLQYHWKEHYVKQPDVLAYLEHVVEKYDLRRYMQFNTEFTSADYDEKENLWRIGCSTGETLTSRYFITALGLLSRQNWPDIPGIADFQGEKYHTGAWPHSYDFKGKRVGIIGNGSTGVQVITALGRAGEVSSLTSFQRHPQYSVPSGDGPVSKEYRESINKRYDEIFKQVRNSAVAFGFEESTVPAMSVSAEERQRKFQESWDLGNGFRFMFWTFSDITMNPEANEAACEFMRSKIRETVKDPEKARKLQPHDSYARRPLCDAGYYQVFNRDNVDIVDINEEPIERITATGIETTKQHYDFDVIIFATGFDAVDGNYARVMIKGRNGQSLQEHWKPHGPETYLGVCVSGFPNFFMLTGPNGPFTNIPPTLETHVEFVGDTIQRAQQHAREKAESDSGTGADTDTELGPVVEATPEAESGWTQLCDDLSRDSLFRKTDSWIFGANVPGKKNSVLFFFGGLKDYRRRLKEIKDGGWVGFKEF